MFFHSNGSSHARKALTAAAMAFCLGVPSLAAAQASPSQADALFHNGLENMRSGKYESACPNLAASYELEPLLGVLFTLAECEAGWGKTATAIRHYQQFLDELSSVDRKRRDSYEERRRIAVDKTATLSATVPVVTIRVPAEAPPNLLVKRDSNVVDASTYGVSVPVDPGEFVITAEIDGVTRWTRTMRITRFSRADVLVPWPLPSSEPRPAATPTPIPTPIPTGVTSTLAADTGSPPSSGVIAARAAAIPAASAGDQHTKQPPARNQSAEVLKYVFGGVGAVGLSTALIAGAVAMSKKSSIEANCPSDRCSGTGYEDVQTARTAGAISTAGFVAGLVGAAGFIGLTVFGRSDHAKPEATADSWQMTVAGATDGAMAHLQRTF